jgi:hypothetical protein
LHAEEGALTKFRGIQTKVAKSCERGPISGSVSSRAGSADDGAGGAGPLLFIPALCPEPPGSYPPRETNVSGDG